MRKPDEGAAQMALDALEKQKWQLHHVRVQAFTPEEKEKAARLAAEFVSLCKANGLHVEHASYPISGHRRGMMHGGIDG